MKQLYITTFFLTAIFQLEIVHSQTISTIAGTYLGNDASGTAIGISSHHHTIDSKGNIYIAEGDKHLVRKLSDDGTYSVIAGNGIYGYAGDGGLAISSQLEYPFDVAIDTAGNLYIADSYDNRIRKVNVNGVITTIAGNGNPGFSGDGGLATNAEINGANAVAVDRQGNVYITDFQNERVRKIDVNGLITTVAGTGSYGSTGDGGLAIMAKLGYPLGIAVDSLGELFISDVGFDNIRKVSTNGIISTIAGSPKGIHGFSGDGGLATSAEFAGIGGSVALDKAGNIFIPDSQNDRIRKVDVNGIVTTVAGNGSGFFTGDGGLATNAGISNPESVTVDSVGNFYISTDLRVRKVNTANIITTIAGNGFSGFNGDNIPVDSAQLYRPTSVAVDAKGNIYIGSDADFRIRKIDTTKNVSTIAGNGVRGITGNGVLATSASLDLVYGITPDKAGNLFISDFAVVRKIDANGIITTVAGNGKDNEFTGDGGPATSAEFLTRGPVAVDGEGNFYIADWNNQRIRKVGTDGIINTIAGNGTAGFSGDGGLAINAELSYPQSVAIDAAGNIIIADGGNNRVRKIDANGIITTIAGNGNSTYSGDGGSALDAGFVTSSVTVDSSGSIYIVDGYNGRVRKVDTNGIIATVAGGGNSYGEGGLATQAQLQGAYTAAIDSLGNIYISDFVNHRIRKVTGSVLPVTLTDFSVRQQDNNALISWKVSNEINVSQYLIQRSTDANTFVTVGTISVANHNNYSYTDIGITQLNAKTVYYRLQIRDNDGKQAYSKIESLKLVQPEFVINIFPNPAKQLLYVKGDDIKMINLINLAGKRVITKTAAGNVAVINVANLPKGIYILKIYNSEYVFHTEKVLIQ